MLADRRRLSERLQRALRGERARGKRPGPPESVERIAEHIERSVRRREARAASLPRPSFPDDLPIARKREEIAAAIAANQVTVVCGETGSGKTTQLPKICLALGRGVDGVIGHTQPRRIAARAVAGRVAEEIGSALGALVGFKVRFSDSVGEGALVKVMTDGVMLAETQGDRYLEQYDTIIIDEAHERSLNIDFLLGYLKNLLPRRPDLKVVITSATIDPQRFSEHFHKAPIIEVSGRSYPVEVRYRPRAAQGEDEEDVDGVRACVMAVDELCRQGPGDILVFLPGEREIREVAEELSRHHPPGGGRRGGSHGGPTEVLPLFARLSAAEQSRVFQPHAGRRVVLSTNVAETSLTVPGIRYVVDTGLARISRYSPRTRVQRLPIEPVSQASAAQRAGRCGRLGPGVCIRLYSEEDFAQRPAFTEPELLRTSLAGVILRMKALRLGDVETFPFLEHPDPRAVREGVETLKELGALDAEERLTGVGASMATLPIDPRLARMILAGEREGALAETIVIAAALSVQDPRERPMDKRDAADAAHAKFHDERSDFVALLNLWKAWSEQAASASQSRLRKWCHEHFVSFLRMREWREAHGQIRRIVTEMGHRENGAPADHPALHRALLAGLLSNVGELSEDGWEYAGARGQRFSVFPGSALFKKRPKWVFAAELVRTTRLYARTVARVDPGWIEQVAGPLLKREHFEPHWRADAQHTEVYEKVSLWSLVLTPKRRVNFGPIDPPAARELFIHHALVEGELRTTGEFLAHNAALTREIETIQAKARRRDILADHRKRFEFYDRVIPAHVNSGGAFERWRHDAEFKNPRLLHMCAEDLLAAPAPEVTPENFPDALETPTSAAGAAVVAPLTYRFDPGAEDDGVTATIPVDALARIDGRRAEWLTRGMLRAKVTAMLRALPKDLRKAIGPAPDFAEECLRNLRFGEGSLEEALTSEVRRATGLDVPRDAWKGADIDTHLRMNFRVVEPSGRPIAAGRDLDALRAELAPRVKGALLAILGERWRQDNLRGWEERIGELPLSVSAERNGVEVIAYPALVDDGESASIGLFDSAAAAERAHRAGVRRLFMIRASADLKTLTKGLPQVRDIGLSLAGLGDPAPMRRDLLALIADRVYLAGGVVRTRDDFERRVEEGWRRLVPGAQEACDVTARIAAAHRGVMIKLAEPSPPAWMEAVEDVRFHVETLTPRGFLLSTPWERLIHLPRYIQGGLVRLQRLNSGNGLSRDAKRSAELGPYWRAWLAHSRAQADKGVVDPALDEFRWLAEEFRVSLLAPELGAAVAVSAKRLDQQWALVTPV